MDNGARVCTTTRMLRAAHAALGALLLLVGGPLPVSALPPGFAVEVVVGAAAFPSAFAFAPDGSRLYYTERFTGQIRVYDVAAGALLPAPFATVPAFTDGADERGLLGIAVDPGFPSEPFVYVFHHVAPDAARITRFTDIGNLGTAPTAIWDAIPAARIHNGGYIGFGPDGKLYVTVGETGVASHAQNPGVVPGKLHRINRDGTVPPDNPFPGSSIWSLGLRNSFGFSFHPVTGSLFLSEPGPTTNDEINRIVEGQNYGWPTQLGCTGDPASDPLLVFPRVTTPNGSVIFASNRYPAEYLHTLLFGEWNTGRIQRSVLLGSPDTAALAATTFLELPGDNLLDLKLGPDGLLWFSTPTSIRRVRYTLPLSLPRVASHGASAIGNRLILSVLGTAGDTAFVVLTSAGTAFLRLIGLGPIGPLGVAARLVEIPPDPTLAGRTVLLRGLTIDPAGQGTLTDPVGLAIVETDPSPHCVATE